MSHSSHSRPPFTSECRWAMRGLKARGTAALFQVGLVGLALATCVLAFTLADAFVFRPISWANADRLVVFQRTSMIGTSDYIAPAEIDGWRRQTDLFADVRAHDAGGALHVPIGGVTELVQSHAVSPGLFELLGAAPQWGRPFVDDDTRTGAEPVVVIAERLARGLFGDPAEALNRLLPGDRPQRRIVGVMPTSFHFPTVVQQVWLPLAADEPRRAGIGIRNRRALALVAPGVALDDALAAIAGRLPAVTADLPVFIREAATTPRALIDARRDPRARLFRMLLGAAVCLLLIACLNVVSLELAAAVRQARAVAVQGVLGATRSSLVRVGLIEAAALTVAALGTAALLASWGADALPALLPDALRDGLANAIDLDRRAVGFLLLAASATWFVIALPAVWRISRVRPAGVLSWSARTSTISRGQAFTRHLLMTGQVALTVMLLIGSLLFVRSYAARASEDKGFDAANLAGIELLLPADLWRSPRVAQIETDVLERLRADPAVRAISRAGMIPPATSSGIGGNLQVHGRAADEGEVKIAGYSIDPDYFDVVRIPIREGRPLTPADPVGHVVVDESFARRFWPDGDAIGASFNVGSAGMDGASVFTIVGIAAHVRGDSAETATGAPVHVVYSRLGSNWSPLRFVVRLESLDSLERVVDVAREAAGGGVVRATSIEERYARLYTDTRIAAGIISVFGAMAMVVALAGTYAVIAFLVAGRTREIGIRLAIGATSRHVQTLVVGPALAFVAAGTALGLGAALGVSRSVESYLFGVTAADPATYAAVGASVIAMAMVSAWWPARRASRIDPAITLRAE